MYIHQVPSTYWAGVILFTAAVEAWTEARKQTALVEGEEWLPGDLGFDPLGLYPSDDSGKKRMQLAEVAGDYLPRFLPAALSTCLTRPLTLLALSCVCCRNQIKHGRVAMLAVVAFACEEAVSKAPVFH